MHPIFAQLEASGATNPFDFLRQLSSVLVSFAKAAIDTPDERQAIERAVFAYYDKYIQAFVPLPMQLAFREALYKMLDSTLVAIAGVTV